MTIEFSGNVNNKPNKVHLQKKGLTKKEQNKVYFEFPLYLNFCQIKFQFIYFRLKLSDIHM